MVGRQRQSEDHRRKIELHGGTEHAGSPGVQPHESRSGPTVERDATRGPPGVILQVEDQIEDPVRPRSGGAEGSSGELLETFKGHSRAVTNLKVTGAHLYTAAMDYVRSAMLYRT